MSRPICVLFSGGIESCAMVGVLAESYDVWPLRVHYGLRWETGERQACGRFLQALPRQLETRQLTVVTVAVSADIRPPWSVSGAVPAADSPDAAVELPERNTILLNQAAKFCVSRGISHIAIGSLSSNPFPVATLAFYEQTAQRLTHQYRQDLHIIPPFLNLAKATVLRLPPVKDLPLQFSMSCLTPTNEGVHCGHCNKCHERQQAFQQAGLTDPTQYAPALAT